MLTIVLTGCATGTGTRNRIDGAANASALEGVDPARAYLPLEEIEPVPKPPAKPEAVQAVSERAAKQIAAAWALAEQQRFTEADLQLSKALRYDPDHPAVFAALAMIHWQAGNVQRALTNAARAVELNPDEAATHYVLGRCHDSNGDTQEALKDYRTALLCSDLNRDPEIATLCHYHLADALAREGYLEAALAQYKAFETRAAGVERPRQPELVTLLQSTGGSAGRARSAILERLGHFDQAADALTPILAQTPEDVALALRHARLLLQAGRLEDALAAARAIPSGGEAVIDLLADIHRKAGHPRRIIEDLRLRHEQRPHDADLVLHLADALREFETQDAARHALAAYLADHEEANAVRSKLVDVLTAQSSWREVLRVCADGVRLDPNRTGKMEAKMAQLASRPDAVASLIADAPVSGDDHVTLYLRGVLAKAAEKPKKAERLLRACLSAHDDYVPARVALARLYLSDYRYQEALRVASRKDSDVAQDARLERLLGEIYDRLDQVEQAERHFKAATQLDRSDTEAMFELAKIYRRSGRSLQAQRQLRVLLEEKPLHEAARELLAFSYFDNGQFDTAVEQLKKLATLAETPTTKARAQALLDRIEDRDSAAFRKALRDAMAKYGPDAESWIAIGDSYTEFDEATKARDAYQSALAIEPDNEEALVGVIRAEQKLLDFEAAAEHIRRILQRRPNRHTWYFSSRDIHGLVDIYGILQDYDTALAVAEKQAGRDDLDEAMRRSYRLLILQTLARAGREAEISDRINAWLAATTDDEEKRWLTDQLARAFLRQDMADKAIPIFEHAYKQNPTDATTLRALVNAYQEGERYERAGQVALEWLNQDPDNDLAVATVADVLATAGRVQDARAVIRNRLLTTLNREGFQDLMIQHLTNAKRYDEAEELTERLIDEVLSLVEAAHGGGAGQGNERPTLERLARRPNDPVSLETLHSRLISLRVQLASVYLAARHYHRAEDHLREWLEMTREPRVRFTFLRALNLCYQAQGKTEASWDVLKRALLLEPEDVTLNNDLAYGWIDAGIRLDEAEPMSRFAVYRSPQQGAYLDTYGWLLYKKGEFAKAKKWLLRAQGSDAGDDPVMLDHLGDVCWRLGEQEQALDYWARAVKQVNGLDDEDLIGADARRVRDGTQQKVDDARTGKPPAVAPLAKPPAPDESQDDGEAADDNDTEQADSDRP